MKHVRMVQKILAVIVKAGGTVHLTDQQFEKLLNILMQLKLPEALITKILRWGENIPALLASGVSPAFVINEDVVINGYANKVCIVEYRF